MKTEKRWIIDPAGGWRYGFPRPIPRGIKPSDNKAIDEWMVSLGYPKEDLKLWCRIWEAEVDINES